MLSSDDRMIAARRSPGPAGRGFPLCVLVAIICAGMVGCQPRQPYVTTERLDRGLVIVLTGIEGRSAFNEAICRGLNDGGVNWAIELYDWTSIFGLLPSLRAEGRNREQAALVADKIVRYRLSCPGKPVMIVGQSGGTAIAAWAAEALPPDEEIDGIVMIASSLSPDYSLDRALAKTSQGIVSFYSEYDFVLLGFGTTIYGTMDGEHTSGAGKVGFTVPEASTRPALYDKLFQIPWSRAMADTGNTGMHLSSGTAKFVATYIAPFITVEEPWNPGMTKRILARVPATTQPACPEPPPANEATTEVDTKNSESQPADPVPPGDAPKPKDKTPRKYRRF